MRNIICLVGPSGSGKTAICEVEHHKGYHTYICCGLWFKCFMIFSV